MKLFDFKIPSLVLILWSSANFAAPSRSHEPTPPKPSQIAAPAGEYISAKVAMWTVIDMWCSTPLFQNDGEEANKGCPQPAAAALNFMGLSANGTSLVSDVYVRTPYLTKYLASGGDTLRLRYYWQIESCDGQYLQGYGTSQNIESIISNFRSYDFNRYMVCRFKGGDPIPSEHVERMMLFRSPSMDILDTGDVAIIGDSQSVYFKRTVPTDPASDAEVSSAAKRFASLVKNYGNLLIALRNASPADRVASLEAFMDQNKQAIILSLQVIDGKIAASGPLTKAMVTFTITQGYQYVRAMEAAINQGYVFDQVVPRP